MEENEKRPVININIFNTFMFLYEYDPRGFSSCILNIYDTEVNVIKKIGIKVTIAILQKLTSTEKGW